MKPANLISLRKDRYGDVAAELGEYAGRLRPRGVRLRVLAECSRWAGVLVYNRELLWRQLRAPENGCFLHRCGYRPDAWNLDRMLDRLSERVGCGRRGAEYPHEIGVFLGYPIEDVEGFIRHGGRDFKLCGYWKVYGDARRASELFRTFDRVRGFYLARLGEGQEIHNISYGGMHYEQSADHLLVGNG